MSKFPKPAGFDPLLDDRPAPEGVAEELAVLATIAQVSFVDTPPALLPGGLECCCEVQVRITSRGPHDLTFLLLDQFDYTVDTHALSDPALEALAVRSLARLARIIRNDHPGHLVHHAQTKLALSAASHHARLSNAQLLSSLKPSIDTQAPEIRGALAGGLDDSLVARFS